jgi:hypothetical protein
VKAGLTISRGLKAIRRFSNGTPGSVLSARTRRGADCCASAALAPLEKGNPKNASTADRVCDEDERHFEILNSQNGVAHCGQVGGYEKPPS